MRFFWWRTARGGTRRPTGRHIPDVHPVDDDNAAPGLVTFDAELNTAGRYGLFFDFKHDGSVHTASFTFDQGPVTGTPKMEM